MAKSWPYTNLEWWGWVMHPHAVRSLSPPCAPTTIRAPTVSFPFGSCARTGTNPLTFSCCGSPVSMGCISLYVGSFLARASLLVLCNAALSLSSWTTPLLLKTRNVSTRATVEYANDAMPMGRCRSFSTSELAPDAYQYVPVTYRNTNAATISLLYEYDASGE